MALTNAGISQRIDARTFYCRAEVKLTNRVQASQAMRGVTANLLKKQRFVSSSVELGYGINQP